MKFEHNDSVKLEKIDEDAVFIPFSKDMRWKKEKDSGYLIHVSSKLCGEVNLENTFFPWYNYITYSDHHSWSGLYSSIPEDICFINEEGIVIFAAVCFPSGWNPDDIIGKDFSYVHRLVPSKKLHKSPDNIVKAITKKGPFKRHTWGIVFDDELRHNPVTDDYKTHYDGELFIRTERQCTVPFGNYALFTIRTEIKDFKDLDIIDRNNIFDVYNSYDEDMLLYKGLKKYKKEIYTHMLTYI